MQIPIKRTVERIPGGFMLVPLLAGALVHTFVPHAAQFFGSFTGALFEGALPILAVFYVCVGSTIAVGALPQVAKRGGALLTTKVALGIAAGMILGHFLGNDPVRAGWFAGVSTLAVVAAINDTNGGLYMALMNQYGTPEETAAYSVMGLESGPFLTMVTLGAAGLATFPWPTLLGAILPLLFGLVVGNLDSELREFLGSATPVMIPFFAFALGATLNLKEVWSAGLVGIGLGLGVLLVSGVALLAVDRLCGGTGTAGVGAATTAGNAAAVPALVAAANHRYAAAAAPATVLVASSVIVTTMLAPLATAWWDARVRKGGGRAGKNRRVLILADDLTGAADGAAACTTAGREAVVLLGGGETADTEVVAIDANTRCRSAEEAAEEMRRLVRLHAGADRMLLKKVDSTLRGHLAVELVAALQARSEMLRDRPVAVFAPAFPAHGRAMVDGELRVHGIPLAEAELRQRERPGIQPDVTSMFAPFGMRTAGLGLSVVRSGTRTLKKAMASAAGSAEVVLCDAETEGDLLAIAEATMALGKRAVWVGSAGLAQAMAQIAGGRKDKAEAPRIPELPAGPTIFVVGSRSRVALEQAERLGALVDVLTLRMPVGVLLSVRKTAEWVEREAQMERALQEGQDVLVLPESGAILNEEEGVALAGALGRIVVRGTDFAGGLVATGGETARAVLDTWDIARLRIAGEVEAGVPFSIAEGWQRALPVVTKAGGFGDPETLVRCREFLQRLKRGTPAMPLGAGR